MIDIADLKKNVGFLNWIAAIATVAIVALYFVLTDKIDERFDKLDGHLRNVQIEATRQGGSLEAIEKGIERMEAKIGEVEPETSD